MVFHTRLQALPEASRLQWVMIQEGYTFSPDTAEGKWGGSRRTWCPKEKEYNPNILYKKIDKKQF